MRLMLCIFRSVHSIRSFMTNFSTSSSTSSSTGFSTWLGSSANSLRMSLAMVSVVTTAALATGCVEAKNPCDPGADEDLQRTASVTGRVVDQEGVPQVGVAVLLVERNETSISAEDGSYVFRDLVPSSSGYTVVALPQAPSVGGRISTGIVGCQSDSQAIDLVVVTPPASPEVEITAATSPDRMLVAFTAAGEPTEERENQTDAPGDFFPIHDFSNACLAPDEIKAGEFAYRAEIRSPFGQWREAVLTVDPRLEFNDDTELERAFAAGLVVSKLNDRCASSLCGHFSYAFRALQDSQNRPRCVEVVGTMDANGTLRRLEHFGQMQVRVRTDLHTQSFALAQQLPTIVPSAAANSTVLSLVPTSVMPVSMAGDFSESAQAESSLDVSAIVPVGDAGRFALITGTKMMVVDGLGAQENAYADTPDAAMALDDTSTESMSEEISQSSGEALAVLAAGNWIRVWKRISDENGLRSMVDKVFVGSERGDVAPTDSEGYQPIFNFDVGMSSSTFRKFTWLVKPDGDPTSYSPSDGYFLLFKDGFVLAEAAEEGQDLEMGALADGLNDDGSIASDYGAPAEGASTTDPDGVPAGFGGFCLELGTAGVHVDETNGQSRSDVCFNVSEVMGTEVNFVDIAILTDGVVEGITKETETSYHLLADKRGDRIMAVHTPAFLGSSGSFVENITEVRVGVDPVAMHLSSFIDCDDNNVLLRKTPVALVANAGSEDVSVISFVENFSGTSVEETGVIALGGVPVGFLTDLTGPTCSSPFVWVRADDGTLFPLDMRDGAAPQCGENDCRVSTRSRSPTGAVTHTLGGDSRVLVGGHGMLGELGFLRPTALTQGVDVTGTEGDAFGDEESSNKN